MAFGSDSLPIEAHIVVAEEEVAITSYHKARVAGVEIIIPSQSPYCGACCERVKVPLRSIQTLNAAVKDVHP